MQQTNRSLKFPRPARHTPAPAPITNLSHMGTFLRPPLLTSGILDPMMATRLDIGAFNAFITKSTVMHASGHTTQTLHMTASQSLLTFGRQRCKKNLDATIV